ncbi:MAG: DUF983 domain-containing protein [Gemmataceae bacterium]
MSPQPVVSGVWGALWAMVRQRCPRCRQGKMFRGLIAMNDPCPVCGLLFQREEGYFLGAMYVSYLLGAIAAVPIYFAAAALFSDWGHTSVHVALTLAYLPLVPLIFRYSRVVWVHFDRYVCPSDSSAGAYEKQRLRELTER